MTYETKKSVLEQQVGSLPEHSDDTTTSFFEQISQSEIMMRSASEGQKEHLVDLSLPEVVGYISEEEQAAFDELKDKSYSEEPDDYDFSDDLDEPPPEKVTNEALGLLPSLRRVIEDDLEILGLASAYDSVTEQDLRVESLFVGVGEMPGRSTADDWHMDSAPFARIMDGELDVPRLPLGYVVANKYPTWFYGGKLLLKSQAMGNDAWRINQEETKMIASADSVVAQAEPYAVVRIGPLGIHSRPIVPEDTNRVFIRILLYPKPVYSHT